MAQGELRFCLHHEPKTFDPLKVEDDASVTIRYLTGGVLVRMNRQTQALEPELAQSWKVSKDGKQITFTLRSGISFSDGTPFSARRCCLHRAAVDGSGAAFSNRRRVPLGPGQRRDEDPFSYADFDYDFRRPWPDSTGSSIRWRSFRHIPAKKKWRCWGRSWWRTTSPAQRCC